MIRRVLWIVILVAIVAVVLNDGGRWFNTRSNLSQATSELGAWASSNLSSVTRDQAADAIAKKAGEAGITVYQYGQDPNGVQIWTQTDVTGTWVLGPYAALVRGVPFKQARHAPFVVKDYVQAQFH